MIIIINEFKDFINRGNVVDMAVGVIIGGAFGTIVSSLVDDIIMPLISLLTAGISFKNLFIALDGNSYATIEQARDAGVAVFAYGSFLQALLDFLIIAVSVFLMVKAINSLRKEEKATEEAPTTKDCPYCKTKINIEAIKCPSCTSNLEN